MDSTKSTLIILASLFFSLLAGCAYKQEGEIDYRKAEIGDKDLSTFTLKNDPKEKCSLKNNMCLKNADDDPKKKCSLKTNTCLKNADGELVRIARLIRKNVAHPSDKGAIITSEDTVSIRLMSAYIANYTEGPWSWFNDALWEGQLRPRGEIAVVVNIYDLSDENAFDFSDGAAEKARLVFYSDDIVAEQFMNFNNMPVYGPTSWGKYGIGFELWIMELDLSDKLTGDLLQTLSSYGRKPSLDLFPGSGILKSVGNNLLNNQNNNDVNFLYRLLLDPRHTTRLPKPFLEAGNYVFIRAHAPLTAERRSDKINWSKLALDENTGRLHKIKTDKHGKITVMEEYRKLSYLVIQVDKNLPGKDLKLQNQLFGEFLKGQESSLMRRIAPVIKEISLADVKAKIDQVVLMSAEIYCPTKTNQEKFNLLRAFEDLWGKIEPSLDKQLEPAPRTPLNDEDFTEEEINSIFLALGKRLAATNRTCEVCEGVFNWINMRENPAERNSESAKNQILLYLTEQCPQ